MPDFVNDRLEGRVHDLFDILEKRHTDKQTNKQTEKGAPKVMIQLLVVNRLEGVTNPKLELKYTLEQCCVSVSFALFT